MSQIHHWDLLEKFLNQTAGCNGCRQRTHKASSLFFPGILWGMVQRWGQSIILPYNSSDTTFSKLLQQRTTGQTCVLLTQPTYG